MQKKNRARLSSEGRIAETAMKEAVADVIREHKFKKIPIVVWRNGRIVKIAPQKLI